MPLQTFPKHKAIIQKTLILILINVANNRLLECSSELLYYFKHYNYEN